MVLKKELKGQLMNSSNLHLKKEKILELIREYFIEKRSSEKWIKGQDWISYSGPNFDEKEYVAAVSNLLNEWLIFGKSAAEFEKEFPQFLGKTRGSLANSGSSANLLMLSSAKSKRTFKFKEGTKIITPVVCFPTTINPIIQNGFTPVFVDVDIPSINLNLDEVERKLKEDSSIRGIIFAHVLGNPPDMDRLMHLIKKYNLVFFEDACDALGSFYDGKKLGSFGDISTCSFFPAHHMTMGEGGFVATDSENIRRTVASLRDWGRACYCNTKKPGNVTESTACGNRFRSWLPGMKEAVYDHRYVFDEIGYNLKPLDLQAAMGLEQIKKLPEMDQARRDNFNKLTNIFSKYEEYFHLPKATEKSDPCWFGYVLTIKDGAPFSKQGIINFFESKRIQTRSYFSGNILLHPGFNHLASDYGDMNKTLPNAQKVTKDSFFLGTYIGLTEEKLNYISEAVDEFIKDNINRKFEV
jgi:CDP-6-deoxy-D-xylo-4-hexulose-3-dehydrase